MSRQFPPCRNAPTELTRQWGGPHSLSRQLRTRRAAARVRRYSPKRVPMPGKLRDERSILNGPSARRIFPTCLARNGWFIVGTTASIAEPPRSRKSGLGDELAFRCTKWPNEPRPSGRPFSRERLGKLDGPDAAVGGLCHSRTSFCIAQLPAHRVVISSLPGQTFSTQRIDAFPGSNS